jgi:hypothetical protein
MEKRLVEGQPENQRNRRSRKGDVAFRLLSLYLTWWLNEVPPLPPFFVNADSKRLSASCKSFQMNTCGHSAEVLILKGLRGQKNR